MVGKVLRDTTFNRETERSFEYEGTQAVPTRISVKVV
jgi:hypothetical protein